VAGPSDVGPSYGGHEPTILTVMCVSEMTGREIILYDCCVADSPSSGCPSIAAAAGCGAGGCTVMYINRGREDEMASFNILSFSLSSAFRFVMKFCEH